MRFFVRPLLALVLILVVFTSIPAIAQEKPKTIIAHFGDSTCMTEHLAPDHIVVAILNVRLKGHYKTEDIVNVNVAQGGDSVRQFLDSKRYERDVKDKLKHIDIAFIRYGMNDMDRRKLDEYKKDLKELCDRVAADYPKARIILESNMYVPYLLDHHNNR